MRLFRYWLMMVIFMVSTPLLAHSKLISTFPAEGAIRVESTDQLALHFNKPLTLISVTLVGSERGVIETDFKRSVQSDTEFKTSIPVLKPDQYQVDWKALGGDGHLMKGTFGFTQQ